MNGHKGRERGSPLQVPGSHQIGISPVVEATPQSITMTIEAAGTMTTDIMIHTLPAMMIKGSTTGSEITGKILAAEGEATMMMDIPVPPSLGSTRKVEGNSTKANPDTVRIERDMVIIILMAPHPLLPPGSMVGGGRLTAHIPHTVWDMNTTPMGTTPNHTTPMALHLMDHTPLVALTGVIGPGTEKKKISQWKTMMTGG